MATVCVLFVVIGLVKGVNKFMNKNYSLIPVVMAIMIIPQLLFWWLAPVTNARYVIYAGGTILTIGIPAAFLVTYWNSNLCKTTGLSVVCSFLEILAVVLSAVLLEMHASVRTAVYVFMIALMVCVIILIPLINSVLKLQRHGIYSENFLEGSGDQLMQEIQDSSDYSHDLIGECTMNRPHSGKLPLPPRNR